jgi:hypothetical protein
VTEARQRRAHAILGAEIELRQGEPLALRALREHVAPRIHDQALAVGRPAARVLAVLCRGNDEHLIFDGPRAKEHMPVILPGGDRERGGHRHHAHAAIHQRAIELRESNVVTDGHPQPDRLP